MSSLSALSNFLGMKDRWKTIIARYGLHWSDRASNLDDLREIVHADRFTDMLSEPK